MDKFKNFREAYNDYINKGVERHTSILLTQKDREIKQLHDIIKNRDNTIKQLKDAKIEYIDGRQKLGIKIDWKLVRKEFRKLHCPVTSHNPLKADMEKCGYVIDLSDRSRGKTTYKLIVGLILFKLYGINLH